MAGVGKHTNCDLWVGWLKVLACRGQFPLISVVPEYLLIVPPFTLRSVPVYMINYTITLLKSY